MLGRARSKLSGMGCVDLRRVEQPFLEIPFADSHFDAVVSSYAFHHVPPPLKPRSIREMVRVIRPGGHWVIGDLVFEDERAEREALERYLWLEDEYFARLGELRPLFGELKMTLHAEQFTPVTWVLSARKPAGSG
jgi:putative AdoMet-dependent methyltransferase